MLRAILIVLLFAIPAAGQVKAVYSNKFTLQGERPEEFFTDGGVLMSAFPDDVRLSRDENTLFLKLRPEQLKERLAASKTIKAWAQQVRETLSGDERFEGSQALERLAVNIGSKKVILTAEQTKELREQLKKLASSKFLNRYSANGLAHIADESCRETLNKLIVIRDGTISEIAINAVVKMADDATVDALREHAAGAPHSQNIHLAITSLGKIGTRKAKAALIDIRDKAGPPFNDEAAAVLEGFDD